MSESAPAAGGPYEPRDAVGRVLFTAARWLALAGGVVLLALTFLSLASILGRWLLARPIPGDYELAQLATASSVAAFLPYCATRAGHVLVDFFTLKSPPRVRSALDCFGQAAIAAIGALLAVRLTAGMLDLKQAGETTMVLEIPQWLAFPPLIVSLALLALAAGYMAWIHGRRAVRGSAA